MSNVDNNSTQTNEDKTSAIDRALAAALARKAAREAGTTGDPTRPQTAGEETLAENVAAATRRGRKNAADRGADRALREAERAARKAAKAAAAAAKKPVHMTKVERAGSRLPELSTATANLLQEATSNLSQQQVAALALHLQHHNRVAATQAALAVKVAPGDRVTIVGGDPRFVGKAGTVSKTQRIRCYVAVDGVAKPVYCFTSDVKPG